MSAKEAPKPAANLDEWLKKPGRIIEEWESEAMQHRAKWKHARLKDNGITVSVGVGPNNAFARADAWENLPVLRR
jgi:hypothetical protein